RWVIGSGIGGLAVRYPDRLCCKTIFRIRARKIDSRSRVNAQHRFKSSFAPIRLLRISIPQLLRGDFCNTIPPIATKERTSICVAKGPQGDMALRRLYKHQPRLGSLFRHPPPLPNLDHNPPAYPSLDDASASLYDTRQIDLA